MTHPLADMHICMCRCTQPPGCSPEPFARALVAHWIERGRPEKALVRACVMPMDRDCTWMRISGAPMPDSGDERSRALSRLVGTTLDVLVSASNQSRCYKCFECLKEAMYSSAMNGRAAALGELLRRIPGDHTQIWLMDDNCMVLLLCRAVFGRSLDAVAVMIDDLTGSLTTGCFFSGANGRASIWTHIDQMLNFVQAGHAAMHAPDEIVDCVLLSALTHLRHISDVSGDMSQHEFHCRMFVAVRACSNAIVSGALIRDSYSTLVGVVKHMRHKMPRMFVQVCLMQAVNVLLRRQDPEPLSRFLASGIAKTVRATYMVVASILCASTQCLNIIFGLQEAKHVVLVPGFLGSAVTRAAIGGHADRMVTLLRFWSEIGLAGRDEALRAALSVVETAACAELIKRELAAACPAGAC